MFENTPQEKEFLSLDDQICFAHEVEIKLLMIQNVLTGINAMINTHTSKYEIDHNILSSFGIVCDGVDYLQQCLGDTLHDSELSSYKTTNEKFLASTDKDIERAYRENIRLIFNSNKL